MLQNFPTFSLNKVAQLASLPRLTELALDGLTIDLAGDVPTGTFPAVRVLHLYSCELRGAQPLGASFCRAFAAMFPSLRELYIRSFTRTDIEKHLAVFGRLCKHQIEYS